MAEVRKPQRRKNRKSGWILAVGLVVVVALAAGTLHFLDVIRIPFLRDEVAKAAEEHKGEVPIPIATRLVREFAQVQPGDLMDPKTQKPNFRYVKEQEVKDKGFLTKYSDAVGRVMRFDKQPGYAFKESDFYPPGSPASPTVGVAEDKRGMWVDPVHVDGLATLNRGDHFQLYAVIAPKGGSARDAQPEFASNQARAAMESQQAWATNHQLIVHDGRVIVPMPKSQVGRPASEKRLFIEIMPEEYMELQQVLTKGAKVYCATLSTLPGANMPDVQDAPKPPEVPLEQIEILSGKNTRRTIVPGEVQPAEEPPKENER